MKKNIILILLCALIFTACEKSVSKYYSLNVYAALVDKDGNNLLQDLNTKVYEVDLYYDSNREKLFRHLEVSDGLIDIGPMVKDVNDNKTEAYLFWSEKLIAHIDWIVEEKLGGIICTKIRINEQEFSIKDNSEIILITVE
ncbi:hypothetical protein [Bacteroides oleiciplenus]|uniref:Lipoprotein n=2 Tax=Bacteroides oleiciplenus TaxID=626931 RepID=K9E4V4_9BACE|nr:hypothetical protein [Bacteroides oleiciplenus]EKU91703.1 hypothetical protein HMPREF9447_01114 [Bacteroides oleiciplenus YIT 12058]RGN38272.1 hypothetical protein DXB65_05395 [Bacteroides oleiciplenus]